MLSYISYRGNFVLQARHSKMSVSSQARFCESTSAEVSDKRDVRAQGRQTATTNGESACMP